MDYLDYLLTNIEPKSTMICLTTIFNFGPQNSFLEKLSSWFFLFIFTGSDNKELDKSNEGLYKEILEKIARVNDREVELLDKDHEEFLKFLNKSQNGRVLKFPQRDPLLPSRRRSSANRRGSSARQGESSLKWSCFIKGVSSSRCLITMVPKNYW